MRSLRPAVPGQRGVGVRAEVLGSPLVVAALAAWVVLVVLQISTAGVSDPLPQVVAIVVLLAVATWCCTAAAVGPRTAGWCLLAGGATGYIAEFVGTRTGVPFGSYTYTGKLVPHAGGVPLIVPLAWFAMGVPAYAVAAAIVPPPEGAPARSPDCSADRFGARRGARCAVGAFALSAWDLFLDPQMNVLGYWNWPGGGVYYGIPLSNYLGWLVVSAVVMVMLDLLLAGRRTAVLPVRGLIGLYASMAVVETVGFLGPLQLRPGVAVLGAAAMGVPAAVAMVGSARPAGRVAGG